MKFTASFVAVLAFVAGAAARPNGSPLCSTDGAGALITGAMGANKGKIDCTFKADPATYTPGAAVKISMECKDIDTFSGFLAYGQPAPSADQQGPQRVGSFQFAAGTGIKGKTCDGDVQQDSENSVITHDAPGKFSPKQDLTYIAPASDKGDITIKVIILKKVEDGFRWGIFETAVVIKGSNAGAAGTPPAHTPVAGDYGAMPYPTPEFSCQCPKPQTISLIRKCKPKTDAVTTIHMTKTVMVTETKTVEKTKKKTVTTTCTTTVTQPCTTTPGDVAGNEETPTSTMEYGTTPYAYETTPPVYETTPPSYETTPPAYGTTPDVGGGQETPTKSCGPYGC